MQPQAPEERILREVVYHITYSSSAMQTKLRIFSSVTLLRVNVSMCDKICLTNNNTIIIQWAIQIHDVTTNGKGRHLVRQIQTSARTDAHG